MKTICSMLVFATVLQHFTCYAQQTVNNNIEGMWKGTSLCQVKPSPCHDENVVYHISKGSADTTFIIQMNKIVNGVEEDMGALDAVYNKVKQTLIAKTKDRQGRDGTWRFIIDGDQMHGTLTIEKNTLYRIIEVKKS